MDIDAMDGSNMTAKTKQGAAPTRKRRSKGTIDQHRQRLANKGPAAYYSKAIVERLARNLVKHVKECGYPDVTWGRSSADLIAFVELVFQTQGYRPFFHVPSGRGKLPFCWNRPFHFLKHHIVYEWGHLKSRNLRLSGEIPSLDDLSIQSHRCNQHIQSSMNIKEVEQWLAGSPVGRRIKTVLKRRKAVMSTRNPAWRRLLHAFANPPR